MTIEEIAKRIVIVRDEFRDRPSVLARRQEELLRELETVVACSTCKGQGTISQGGHPNDPFDAEPCPECEAKHQEVAA